MAQQVKRISSSCFNTLGMIRKTFRWIPIETRRTPSSAADWTTSDGVLAEDEGCALHTQQSTLLEAMLPHKGQITAGHPLLDQIDVSSIVRLAKQAKESVDHAFTETRSNFKQLLRARSFSPFEAMAYFRQPVGNTRNALRAAEKREEIIHLLGVKLDALNCENFNLTGSLLFSHRRRPWLGAADRAFARWLPAQYEDGISLPRGWKEGKRYFGHTLPLVRDVSNRVVRYLDERGVLDQERSQLFTVWGQWVDHDLDFSPESPMASPSKTREECTTTCAKEANCFPIMIPPNDPMGNRRGKCIALFRTGPACPTETMVREQLNSLTSFIDAGMVYGSTASTADSLRNKTNDLGLLAINHKFQDGNRAFLPFEVNQNSVCASTDETSGTPCFIAGDRRASEHTGLITLHTLFVREHNRLAGILKTLNPRWNGEKIYQESRKIVGAMMQIITFRDYIPNLLGDMYKREIPEYSGYDEYEDPRVANIFSIAFRFGHATVSPFIFRLDNNYRPRGNNYKVPLHKIFFATWRVIKEGGIDPLLRGLLANEAKLNIQNKMLSDELRERLFENPQTPGLDLASFNMQRGRDHGLVGYNSWRRFCNLPAPRNLQELAKILKNTQLARRLLELYKTPENIDIWLGGVAEPFVKNGRVGPLLSCILGRQFKKIRNGDRFWWQNPGVFTYWQRTALGHVSLPQIICANTGITHVPRNVFRANEYPKDFIRCDRINQLNLSPWRGGYH
ncbi:eosinophil peroxidase-like [Pleurodeles waltl]|uniref:eosinophil peroxidase-like n=1 Tax=Pleurodeles waltl TaxID=8319 RepID=UPI0037098209